MPTVTSDQALTIPSVNDVNNGPTAFGTYTGADPTTGLSSNSGVETRLVKRYLSTADRSTRNPFPAEGEYSYLIDSNTIWTYDGTKWTWPYGRGIVARGVRTTNSTGTTTAEQGVIRLDNIPIINGRAYRIWTSPFIYQSSVAGDLITVPVRVNTAGIATTASTQITGLVDTSQTGNASQRTKGLDVAYFSGTTGSLSVLVSVVRTTGTGTVAINASSGFPLQLVVEDIGIDPGDSGVII